MTTPSSRRLALALVLLCAALPALASAEDPRFVFVTATGDVGKDGAVSWSRRVFGEFGPGLPVLLLPTAGATTCAARTDRLGDPVAGGGRCTRVVGGEACREVRLAVVGSLPADHRPIGATSSRDPVRLRALGAASGAAGRRRGSSSSRMVGSAS
jgi:hypothetical protein